METLGFGDWLPDFTQTPAMKSLAGGLTAFKGPLQGLIEGKLGIQQPGWRPGMPVAALGEGGGGGRGLALPFGLPSIELPPAPGPPEHAGTGAPPGPTTNQSIDMSINYNAPVGSDRPKSSGRRVGAGPRYRQDWSDSTRQVTKAGAGMARKPFNRYVPPADQPGRLTGRVRGCVPTAASPQPTQPRRAP